MVANRDMEDTVVLTLAGYGDVIPARAFVQALTSFLGLLQDLDASVSGNKQGSVEWEISLLSKNSPARIGYRGHAHHGDHDRAREVGLECVRGIQLLADRPERSERYSDAALGRTLKLARFRQKTFSEIDVNSDNEQARVTLEVYENIDALTRSAREEEASLVGSLDSITVHKGNEFRVWDERNEKPVRCFFSDALLEKAKAYLGQRVMVVGKSRINRLGNIVSVDAKDIESYTADEGLPTIEQMSGSVKNITGGMSIRDYIKVIRDDE
jgi:hypothetical protein